ncbi:NAD(P)/FAD-dependent oxidoreductase [Parvularcula oceani]|uniref:NAD(P)/FAD-dependent oxidoreductase n=1 Tax=Parvularcula oceani TaxID=1247963 RepID=UPI0004E24D5E|nr:NAD(P)/FAD-dependent oxidoreductase [Parvularcula oceani]
MDRFDVIIAGAGAAGMFCAWEAAKRGRRVLVLEGGRAPGEKIRISGGGRCNFTNLHAAPECYLSQNPHFCRSALARYTQWDFLGLIGEAGIAWHEKTLGQLFCDGSSMQIVDLLANGMRGAGAALRLNAKVEGVAAAAGGGFTVSAGGESLSCQSLVLATGGKSIPKLGATGLGYKVARQFGLPVEETRPALVPLTVDEETKASLRSLVGVAAPVAASCGEARFDEAALFTHRGISGPAILQLSSYWREGQAVSLDLSPDAPVYEALKAAKAESGRRAPRSVLAALLPKSLAAVLTADMEAPLAETPDNALQALAERVHAFTLTPAGSEGYRTAEVTLGGVSTDMLDQKTMQARAVPGLYFVGEVVDVTGWLGGYNFQWAWSSGWAAGQAV